MGDALQAALTSTRSPVPGGPVEPDGSSPDAETPGQGLEALARLVESGDSLRAQGRGCCGSADRGSAVPSRP